MLSSLLVDECGGAAMTGVANCSTINSDSHNFTTNLNNKNNLNPLLPQSISLPFDEENTICLGLDGTECYKNQPKLYNILKAFDPTNYEGIPVNVNSKDDSIMEGKQNNNNNNENLDKEQSSSETEKWNLIQPGRFVYCSLNENDHIARIQKNPQLVEDDKTLLYAAIVLTHPKMKLSGNYLGIQLWDLDDDDDEDAEEQLWVNIDWCEPDDPSYTEILYQSSLPHKMHYVVENNNPIHHRAFSKSSLLSSDGIINSISPGSGGETSDDDDKLTLFTYSDIFYVEKDNGGDRKYEILRHPLPDHILEKNNIDLSLYNYQIAMHESILDPEVQMLDNKYELYTMYSSSPQASEVFPVTFGSIEEAFRSTSLEQDQIFYIKSCCEARGLDIGLFHLSDLHRILMDDDEEDEDSDNEEEDSEEEDENIQLLKKFWNYGSNSEDYDYDYDYHNDNQEDGDGDHEGEEEEQDPSSLVNDNEEQEQEDNGDQEDDEEHNDDNNNGDGSTSSNNNDSGEYVVQKAVHDLYTLDYGPLKNRRFDIRFYVIVSKGKVYMHANGHMKWVIGNFEFDPLDTTLSRQVSNIAVYGGGDTARWVFPYEMNGNTSWKTRNNMKQQPPSSDSSSSSSLNHHHKTTTEFDPYGWRDAVSRALDKASDAVFERAKRVTLEDNNKYFFMGGDAVIRENGEASIIEFNVWPDVDKYGRFNDCLGNADDKSSSNNNNNCRRFVMLENDTYGMMEKNDDEEEDGKINNTHDGDGEDDGKGKKSQEDVPEPPGYYVTDLNIITDVVSSEGLARVMRDMVLLVTGTQPAENILGLREIGSQFIQEA